MLFYCESKEFDEKANPCVQRHDSLILMAAVDHNTKSFEHKQRYQTSLISQAASMKGNFQAIGTDGKA